MKWIKDTQQSIYWKEINNLQMIAQQPKTARASLVQQLRLFLDSDELLHCSGHIYNAPVSGTIKFPFLLPSKHPLSRLIILNIHITLVPMQLKLLNINPTGFLLHASESSSSYIIV